MMRFLPVALVGALASTSCSGGAQIKRGYEQPQVAELVEHLSSWRDQRASFRHESVMDYWVGDDRVKGTVLLMGKWGARLRFNALNPTGDNVAADFACDGVSYYMKDVNNNCTMQGPCTGDAIARMFRINLEPDDFLLMALGGTPLLQDATGQVTWDAEHAREILLLTGPDGNTQTIVLDGRKRRWDVLESVMRDPRGNVLWTLHNKDFHEVTSADGKPLRMPGKTKFEQPSEKSDLLIRWKKHELNVPLDEPLFFIDLDPSIPRC